MSEDKRELVSYWSLLLDSFKATGLAFATVISVVVGILVWIVGKDTPIPAWVGIPSGVFLTFVVVAHADALRVAARKLAFGSMRVKAARREHPDFTECDCVCVVETAVRMDLFANLPLYFTDQGYEYDLGIGIIQRHQDGGTAILTVHRRVGGGPVIDSFIKRLQEGNVDAIRNLRVRTALTRSRLPETKNESVSGVEAPAASGPASLRSAEPALPGKAGSKPEEGA